MAVGIGSRGYKDFGLSNNMTLPINSEIEPDPKVLVENAFMPVERKERSKKHARFALEGSAEQQETGAKVQIEPKQSWFKRLFRRSKKGERSAPYLVQPKENMKIVRSESDPELSASKSPPAGQVDGNRNEGEAKPQRRKAKTTKSSRQTKALSTAFEHITPVPITVGQDSSAVEVVFKPSYTSSIRKVVLQYRKESADGLGLHLSGGIPPVTVTGLKKGGPAEVAGIGVGDVILEVNVINCEVETSQLVALKLLHEHTPPETRNVAAEQEDKMIGREEELEADHSAVKISHIDSSGSEEDTASPRVVEAEVKIIRKGKKKRISSTRASGGDFGDPLAASSPIKEQGAGNGDRPKRKKKTSNRSLTSGEEADSSKVSKSSPAKSPVAPEGGKTGEGRKKKKRKTSKNSADVSEHVARSPSKKSASKTSISSDVPSPEVKTVPVEMTVRSHDTSISLQQQSISVDEVDGSYEMERSTRSRRSSSPKSRYRMGEQKEPENGTVTKAKASEEGGEPEKVTVGVVAKEKSGKKKSKATDGEKKKKKKRKKSTEEFSPRKQSKEESQPSSRKVSATAKEHPPTGPTEYRTEEPLSLSVDEPPPPPQSAAISGSIESNTLTFVSKKGSKSSLNELGRELEEAQNKRETSTLPRRKSTDQSRSSSESEFRNELREASRSQHDMPAAINSSMTIEIDPNIKVKKSGIVKGKTPVRPSIFDQSSSPEPEEVAPISSGPVEDNLLDSEFKVKKSGIVQGRKTSSTSRPSILDEKETKASSPHDIQQGEIKYNKKVTENMDLSDVPETVPTLGVAAGRDRLDTANRSLVKRRPASQKQSLLLDSTEDKIMGTGRVDLSQMADNKPVGSVGAAKQLFDNSSQQDAAKYSNRFSKLEKKPISATPQANKPPEMRDKKVPVWAKSQTGEKENTGKPSWIALAEQKKSSFAKGKETTTAAKATPVSRTPADPSSTTTTSSSQESSVPQLGHVAQRLAMFQKS